MEQKEDALKAKIIEYSKSIVLGNSKYDDASTDGFAWTSRPISQHSNTPPTLLESKRNLLVAIMRRHVLDIRVVGVPVTPTTLKVKSVTIYRGLYKSSFEITLCDNDLDILCTCSAISVALSVINSSRTYACNIGINNGIEQRACLFTITDIVKNNISLENKVPLSEFNGTFGGFEFKDLVSLPHCNLNVEIVSDTSYSNLSSINTMKRYYNIGNDIESIVFKPRLDVPDYLDIRNKQNKLWSRDLTSRAQSQTRNHDAAISLCDARHRAG